MEQCFGDICLAFASYARNAARLRDRGSYMAKLNITLHYLTFGVGSKNYPVLRPCNIWPSAVCIRNKGYWNLEEALSKCRQIVMETCLSSFGCRV